MARALWTGSLSFGLVNVPVQLVSAVRDLDLHFRQIHEKDDTPIETHRVCSKEGKEVPYEEIGNEYDGVVVTDEELSAADPAKTRTIDIESFVKLDEIDPIYYDHPYYLVPAGETDGTVRAYRLLAGVMEQTRPGRDRALRAADEGVPRRHPRARARRSRSPPCASPTRCARPRASRARAGARSPRRSRRPSSSSRRSPVDWDPSAYEDEYRKRLQAIVRKKRKGGEIKLPEADPERTQPVPDLMKALEESRSALHG